jgi:HK97 family phage portal protein
MKLNPFRIFSKKEQKSTPACEGNFAALIPGLNSQLYRNKQYDLAANQTLEYYQQCAPLHDAITRIVLEVAAIEPEIYDKQKNVFIQNHKLLEDLNNPNAISSYEDFVTEIATSYLLTANTFLTADGDINRPPASLNVIPPPYIRYDLAADGYVKSWNIESLYLNLQYLREMAKLRYRYYNQMKTSELYQIRGFSWYSSNCKIWGISQLNSIWYEIEQYIISSIHNLSVLDKGATISGVFSTAEMLSDDAYQRLRAEITNLYSGAGNAGRSLLAEGDLKFNAISQSNRDMDFATLKDKVTKQIYKNLKIPLPLIDEGTMTLANLEASALLLYDNAVLPLVKRIFSELTRFLMPRYPNSDNLVLWFDDNKITALEPRRLANLKQKAELNALTANEIRKDIQMPPFANGADQLYQPATLIPYADTIEQPK